uniref:Uncharacterized protein n=1 Tax=Arundo donax TaxID=35708 RepID=A0A0A8YPI1_ARUDO
MKRACYPRAPCDLPVLCT